MLQPAPAQPQSASGNADGTTGSGAASATNVPDVEAAAYSQELAGMSLDRLRQEPWRLRTAQEEVVSNLTAVSLRHYRLHIENFECATIVKREMLSVKRKCLDSFDSQLGSFGAALASFQARGAALQAQHQRNRNTLKHHTQLLDLLEVPQVMDTCVRNGLYEKALDVVKFAATVHMRHKLHLYDPSSASAADTPGAERIIYGIVRDVRDAAATMRDQLLRELRGKLSLPACLRVVGYLRSLSHLEGSFGDPRTARQQHSSLSVTEQLKREFLACRDAWHTHELQSLAPATPYNYFVNAMELQRTQWSDIIAQYQAVFAVAGSDGTPSAVLDHTLHEWLAKRVRHFLELLQRLLGRISDGSNIASVLDLSSYCGSRLARYGADFRALLPPLFEQRVVALMQEQWAAAAAQFYADVTSWDWAYRVSFHDEAGGSASGGTTTSDSLAPPEHFIGFAPIADLTNGFLASLNHLRNCALTATGPQLGTVFANMCQYLADALLEARTASHSRAASASTGGVSVSEARERFHAMCQVLAADFMPYASRCFHAVMQASDGSLCSYGPARDQLERATLYQPVRAPEPLSDDVVDVSVVDGGTEPVGSGTGGDAGVLGPPDESEAARAEQVVE